MAPVEPVKNGPPAGSFSLYRGPTGAYRVQIPDNGTALLLACTNLYVHVYTDC